MPPAVRGGSLPPRSLSCEVWPAGYSSSLASGCDHTTSSGRAHRVDDGIVNTLALGRSAVWRSREAGDSGQSAEEAEARVMSRTGEDRTRVVAGAEGSAWPGRRPIPKYDGASPEGGAFFCHGDSTEGTGMENKPSLADLRPRPLAVPRVDPPGKRSSWSDARGVRAVGQGRHQGRFRSVLLSATGTGRLKVYRKSPVLPSPTSV